MRVITFVVGMAAALLPNIPAAQASVISISGVIEGRNSRQTRTVGETMDYLKFEMLSTGDFKLIAPNLAARFFVLASFIGDNTQFEPVLGETVLTYRAGIYDNGNIPTLARTLEAGTYILIVDAYEDSQYDFGDGFVAVNVDGGFFPRDPYSFTIEGDVRGIEFWEGQLDPQPFGSFIITTIPEPTTSTLVGGSYLLLLKRNATNRKENKSLQLTPRGWLVSKLRGILKCLGLVEDHSRP